MKEAERQKKETETGRLDVVEEQTSINKVICAQEQIILFASDSISVS